MDSLLDIGSTLTAVRRERGMSQRELGARLGVVQQQIARWEASGYRAASLERVDAVARELGYPTESAEAVPLPMAAEALGVYGASTPAPPAVASVRDLGEIAARIRANGRELKERFGILRVGVFGSFADGGQTDSSDVDLLVDMPEPGGFLFIQAAQHMEDLLGREVDFIEARALHPRMRERVLRESIYVWSA
jgi:hypothetical protein